MKEIYFNTNLQQKWQITTFLKEIEKTTIVDFFKEKCDSRHLFNKVFSVLGAKKIPTRFSKYENILPENDKKKSEERLMS